MLEELEKMITEDIKKITEYNYNYAYEHLNIKNDIHVVEEKIDSNIAISSLFELVIKLQGKIIDVEKENKEFL